jgi:hypothetical protein
MTYGVQDELRKFRLKKYLKQTGTVLAKTKDLEFAEEGDPLLNYDIDGTNEITRSERQEEADPNRYLKERRVVMNINSRFRLDKRPVVLTEQELKTFNVDLWNEFWVGKSTDDGKDDDDEELFINGPDDCLNRDFLNKKELVNRLNTLNNKKICEYGLFNDRVVKYVNLSDTPNSYIFPLPKTLNNIKTIGLLSTEIPKKITTINSYNNLIYVDVKIDDKDVEYNDDYILPYLVVQIPPGNYDLEELSQTIQESLNGSFKAFTSTSDDIFNVYSDVESDAFVISTITENVKFWIKMCPHPKVEQLSLHYMLGFKHFESTIDSSYINTWDNLVDHYINPKVFLRDHSWVVNDRKPYRPIDLNPYKYIYLSIKGFGTMTDPLIKDRDLFAKIQLECSDEHRNTLFNTFIDNPKIFLDTPLRILTELDITWVDAWGNTIDFHGQEHSFTLEFVQYIDYLVDSNFSSVRGTRDPTSFTESSLHK